MKKKETVYFFLDVDGVLNTRSQWKQYFTLDSDCVSRFVDYVDSLKCNPRIILTSSWKNGFDAAGNHTPQVFDLIDKFAPHNIVILGKTETRSDGDRAQEINDFIVSHHLESANCIAFDDDPNLFRNKLVSNCKMIWCDADNGFVPPVAKKTKPKSYVMKLLGR